jgi:predicted AAA+ superfamily ATPase
MFTRSILATLVERFGEPRRFIQVLRGPRQTGKTTLARQLIDALDIPCHYASGDEPTTRDRLWLSDQWDRARRVAMGSDTPALLILDEVQKTPGWSETVKRLWDEDTAAGTALHVLLLGSSSLMVTRGLGDSLAGRFEVVRVSHWSFAEMQEAFGFDLGRYLRFGGYPGAAGLTGEPDRWRRYVLDSLIEPTISRDVLLMTRVDKPALLRRVFELACTYSGRILSFQKMLGQLQDAGNTTTVAHYLDLLDSAGLVAGLEKYSGDKARRRRSSPKLLALNTALMTATAAVDEQEMRPGSEFYGRLAETAVGAWLRNGLAETSASVCYWASGQRELDFVIAHGDVLVAVEVKSGARARGTRGIDAFAGQHTITRKLLVGTDGIPFEDFLLTPPVHWLE